MFTKRVPRASIEAVDRKLTVTVQRQVFKSQPEQEAASAPMPTCENGVCTVNWKPQRPAA